MDSQEIKDTLKDARDYLSRLEKLSTDLNFAEEQIRESATETEVNIKRVFDSLLATIKLVLFIRRDDLISKTAKIKDWGLTPLLECRKVVEDKIESTSTLISLGEGLLQSKEGSRRSLDEFCRKSSLLGSLPEIPQLKDVPHLSFQYESSCEKHLTDICHNIGSVIHIAPVQIVSLKEKPGAILVQWNASDTDDRLCDIQQYELQKATGNRIGNKHKQNNYQTCYFGTDTQYLVKDLVVNQQYTFRVRCKFDGETEWSPWSLSEVGLTKLKPFCWSYNDQFILANENKIAAPANDVPSILFSNKVEFNVGYSVEFTFLECDANLNDMFVGLFLPEIKLEGTPTKLESICVEGSGNIYSSGAKKSTQLPPVTKGSKICFTCELKDKHKMRINIDSCGKRVTYDWPVDGSDICFGAKFSSSRWKVMID